MKKNWGVFKVTCRASYTVESVFLFPIFIVVLAFMLYLCIDWYENVHLAAEDIETLQQLDTRNYFLNQDEMQSVLDVVFGQSP